MKEGVLLLNMGGPNNLDEVEVFLKNMFNDPNIITVKSTLLRKFIAFMITTFRVKEATKNYEQLGGKSPIVGYTKELVKKLERKLPNFEVEFAMCYTPPFSHHALTNFIAKGVQKIYVVPLYPHYSTTTVKSSLEDFYETVKKLEIDFEIKIAKIFYKNRAYNEVLLKRIREALKGDDAKEYDLVFSAHSLPKKIVDRGDPYQKQIEHHVEILKELLQKNSINFNKIHLAYQSKLGPVEWLKPELGETLEELENKKVIILPISFTIDNSETEFELDIEYKEVADELSFKEYKVVKCPNSEDEFVDTLAHMIKA